VTAVIYVEMALALSVSLEELLFIMLREDSYIEKQIIEEKCKNNLSYYYRLSGETSAIGPYYISCIITSGRSGTCKDSSSCCGRLRTYRRRIFEKKERDRK